MFAFTSVSNFRIKLSILSSSYCYPESDIEPGLEKVKEVRSKIRQLRHIFDILFSSNRILSLACNFFLSKKGIFDMKDMRHLGKFKTCLIDIKFQKIK